MRTFIYPYGPSTSARLLAEEIGARRINLTNSNYRPRETDLVINWGNSRQPAWQNDVRMLNRPASVAVASNKLHTLMELKEAGVSTVPWTVNKREASAWGVNEVVCRTRLSGHSGDGIVMLPADQDLPDAPLYTKYVKKTAEYRVHVFCQRTIRIQQKKRRNGVNADSLIRSHANGWIYANPDEGSPVDDLTNIAFDCTGALKLAFGAVDIIYNRHHGLFVLEVNTAPGLEGSTLTAYADVLNRYREELADPWFRGEA